MRKVTFYIDDLEWFRKFYDLTDKQMKDLFLDKDSFKVIYTLYGEKDEIDHYTLTDYDGNKIDYNTLNGFQRGVVFMIVGHILLVANTIGVVKSLVVLCVLRR